MLSKFALERWLAKVILDKDIGRKPPKSERKGPPRDWKYRAWIRSFPCACCGSIRYVEAAHTGEDGGMSMKSSDYSCVPLCALCHRTGPKAYHVIGKDAFEKLRGLHFGAIGTEVESVMGDGKEGIGMTREEPNITGFLNELVALCRRHDAVIFPRRDSQQMYLSVEFGSEAGPVRSVCIDITRIDGNRAETGKGIAMKGSGDALGNL